MQTQAKKEKTAVIEKPTFSVASIIDQYGDAGLENVTANQMAMPFIKLISDASYERRPGHEKHIEGAQTGMICNSVTKKLYDGSKGILVVPCYYKFEYIEWKERGTGGVNAPVKIYSADSDIVSQTKRDAQNRDRLPNGNYLEGTASHFILLLNEDQSPHTSGLLTMSRTQAKKSRKWNSMMRALPKIKNSKGDLVSQPSFSQVYRLSTVQESNGKGQWTGWAVNHVGPVTNQTAFKAAVDLYEACRKGVSVNYEEDMPTTTTETQPIAKSESTPF
jgi:hypothetical protein